MISLTPEGKTTVLGIKGLEKAARKGIRHGAYIAGKNLVRATSQEILKKPKGGKTYIRRTRSGRRIRHVASSPGETHANMSGTLRKSLGFKANTNQLEFGYGVDNKFAPDYAESVEEGTSKMKARPSIKNGINDQRRNILNTIEQQIDKRIL